MPYKNIEDRRAAYKKDYKNNPQKYYGRRMKWARENPRKYFIMGLLRNARSRAKRKDIPFTLTHKEITERISTGMCEVTSLPFTFPTSEKGERNPWQPSLDQKILGKGYTSENTQVVVLIYNMAKDVFTDENVKTLSRALLNE